MASTTSQARNRRLAVRGSLWVVSGQGLMQLIRLASNLVLTRLLIPDYFGLMALVQIFSQGVQMFSDVGLRGNVVQSERGEDPHFLDTVWTVQVIRGAMLWLVVCLLAHPAAAFYREPRLLWMVPIVGLGVFVSGFKSTAVYTLVRRVRPGRRVALDLTSRLGSVAVMITWAWVHPSVWALIAGNLANILIAAVLSHELIPGYSNRFRLEREALRSILHFGKWIFLSTALTFLLSQGDRIVLGKLITMEELGVYSIALVLATTIGTVVGNLSATILFPLYARIARDPSQELRSSARSLRLGIMGLGMPPLWLLALYGPEVVSLLYDERYAAAGWMSQLVAIGSMATILIVTAERLLLALGDSYRFMQIQLLQTVLAIAGLAVGAYVAGLFGALAGIAAGRWLGYGVVAGLLWKRRLWMPEIDVPAVGVSALVAGLALMWA